MSTEEKELAPTPVEEVLSDKEPENLLEQLAAKRREISENREIDIPVPGYDSEPPLLLIRYRLLDGQTLTLIGSKIRRQTGDRWHRALNAALDTFIASCVGFYVDLGDGVVQPLTYKGEHITGFTVDLAEALQFTKDLPDNPTNRHVALGLFAGNDVAVTQHSFMLNRWFQNTSIDINEEMLLEGNL
jgi:hypothetical protein